MLCDSFIREGHSIIDLIHYTVITYVFSRSQNIFLVVIINNLTVSLNRSLSFVLFASQVLDHRI